MENESFSIVGFSVVEVVEHACGMATLQMGEFVPNVSSGIDTYSIREPLGVCAGICPFNFPAMIPLWVNMQLSIFYLFFSFHFFFFFCLQAFLSFYLSYILLLPIFHGYFQIFVLGNRHAMLSEESLEPYKLRFWNEA